MTPERWKRIKQILDDVWEREPEDRDTFLREACGGDPDLRAEVDALTRTAIVHSTCFFRPATFSCPWFPFRASELGAEDPRGDTCPPNNWECGRRSEVGC